MRPVAFAARPIPRTLTVAFLLLVGAHGAHPSEILWTYHVSAGHVDASPALGDVNADGACDIVVAT